MRRAIRIFTQIITADEFRTNPVLKRLLLIFSEWPTKPRCAV